MSTKWSRFAPHNKHKSKNEAHFANLYGADLLHFVPLKVKGVDTRSPLPLFDSTNGKMTHYEVIRGHKKFGPK